MFGDVKLNGVVRQQVSKHGDLWYKGVMHFFGSKMPIQVIIKPTPKSLKGDKLYYIFTYLPAQKYQAKTKAQKHIQWTMVRARARAEKKVVQILKTIGIIYDYKKNKPKEKPSPAVCKRCVRKSRRGYIKIPKGLSRLEVQRLLSASARDKQKLG